MNIVLDPSGFSSLVAANGRVDRTERITGHDPAWLQHQTAHPLQTIHTMLSQQRMEIDTVSVQTPTACLSVCMSDRHLSRTSLLL